MPGQAKTMTGLTVGGLVLVTAYTVTLGNNGWLWLTWAVLGLATIGTLAARGT
ncbi:hypothetical protein GCM10010218_09620 [Streptomyces mashuensis]|uniref:Integral membrane protein n=2 Tax=Streptomyces mashuensis TaxID=33904 RepID=A0A919AZN7_9ACTN|nr:hypothetical protein GCM10010218_09620 [Streptomyces mashuensis]